MRPEGPNADPVRTMTLEAYADTIVPGARRRPDDRAIAGMATDDGAVAAGAIDLLEHPGTGMPDALDSLAYALNDHAAAYAQRHGLVLDEEFPAFVALPFEHRTALVQLLTAPDHPEKQMWVSLALFSNMAFDSAAQQSTADAFATGHPGLRAIGYHRPGEDGIFRFSEYSYGRQLAEIHPETTPTGSLA